MAATNSAFRTETRDEHLYNHIELFNRSSSPIDAPAANRCQDCRERQPTQNQIATGRRMFGDYRTEPSNEHLYNNIQSINKPSSPATESQAANQTSQDDRRRQQPTGNSKTMGRRVSSAMMAVLALAFLAMLASLIATAMVHVMKSGTNGCQQQQNNELKNLDNAVEKMIKKGQDILQEIENLKASKEKETKNFEQAIRSQTLQLKQEIEVSIENQTDNLTSEFEDLAARVNQTDEGRRQDGLVFDRMKQELNKLTDMVSKIKDQVSSDQTERRRWLEKKINDQTLELKEERRPSKENQTTDHWIKVNNSSPICFGAKDNNFDFFVPYSGKLASVKLVHLSGTVTCANTHSLFWGCGGNLQDVNVLIKKLPGTTILRLRKFSTGGEQRESYNSSSQELVLSAYSNPPSVIAGQKLLLSNGQTPRQITGGRWCCDVYVSLIS